MVKRAKLKINQSLLTKITVGFICLYLLFHFGKSFKNSLFFTQKDRLNVVFYAHQQTFVSFGLTDKVHYLAHFDNNLLVFVPGGYGRYKIGSLGKLANLEKKPTIVKNTFSSVASTFIDFYFYPKKAKVYSESGSFNLNPLEILKINYQTNANFFDRVYLFFLLLNKRKSDFSLLNTDFNVDEKNKFYEDDFFTKYQGYFYQKFLRDERKNLQIYYKNYKSAQILNRIIEGEGIRVVDLTTMERKEKNCQVIENSSARTSSKTAIFLSKVFSCKIEKGETGVGDLRMILGEKLEKEWE